MIRLKKRRDVLLHPVIGFSFLHDSLELTDNFKDVKLMVLASSGIMRAIVTPTRWERFHSRQTLLAGIFNNGVSKRRAKLAKSTILDCSQRDGPPTGCSTGGGHDRHHCQHVRSITRHITRSSYTGIYVSRTRWVIGYGRGQN